MGNAQRWFLGGALVALAGCLAAPPRTVEASSGWRVKSDASEEARAVCELFERLEPRLAGIVPDWRLPRDGQIWVQAEPKLYAFPVAAKSEAEGLWAESERCILLARGADDVERTLAHEMVHAGLGADWELLPGSLEEGLCDWVAAQACPNGAARLRAGRLSSALLALGGLELDLRLALPAESQHSRSPWEMGARIVLAGEEAPLAEGQHHEVFRLQAGLSTTRIAVGQKRNYYGLAYLIVDRIADRVGLTGLYALCREARARELSVVPSRWLLEAAGLESSASAWRSAALSALGPAELTEILRMYPDFVVAAIVRAQGLATTLTSAEELADLSAEISLRGGAASLDAAQLDFVRQAVATSLAQRSTRLTAVSPQ